MATANYPDAPWSFMNDQVQGSLQYDDQTLRITSYTITNNYGRGKVIVTLRDPNTRAVIDTTTVNANTGTTVKSLTSLNQFMVHQTGTGKYGPYDIVVPPFIIEPEFQST